MTPSEAYSRFWLPVGATAESGDVDRLIVAVHIFMALLFFGWGAFFVWCLIRWRAKDLPAGAPHPAAPAQIAPRLPRAVEASVVLVEVGLLAFVSIPLWSRLRDVRAVPDPERAVRVRVVAQQFQWNVHYAGPDGKFGPTRLALVDETENPLGLDRSAPEAKDDVVAAGALRAPIGRPLVVELSSKDVIHSFKVPVARVTQDAVPGVPSSLWFTPVRAGSFDIECAQLCGIGHTRMRGVLVVMEEAEYQAWVEEQERKRRK